MRPLRLRNLSLQLRPLIESATSDPPKPGPERIDGPRGAPREKTVYVGKYLRLRYGKWETVVSRFRRPPRGRLGRQVAAAVLLLARRSISKPAAPDPASISSHVAASGTLAAELAMTI
jgi:hypothetical protein